MDKREQVQELAGVAPDSDNDDDLLLFADGLDDALIGVVERFGMPPVALYDRDKVIEHFAAEAGDDTEEPYLEAEEHFGFNVIGAWVGERTPAYARLLPSNPDDLDGAAAEAREQHAMRHHQLSSREVARQAWDAAIAWARRRR